MSKFCLNCGNELADMAVMCPQCGTAQEEAQPAESAEKANSTDIQAIAKDMLETAKPIVSDIWQAILAKKQLFIIIGGAVAGLIVIALVLSLIFGGNGAKGAIDNMMKAAVQYDKNAVSALVPNEAWDYIDDEYGVDVNDVKEYIDDNRDDMIESTEDDLGENLRFSYKIVEQQDMDKDDLKDLKSELKDSYGITAKSVSSGLEVEIEGKIYGSDDEEEFEATVYLVKIGNNYYVAGSDGDLEGMSGFMMASMFAMGASAE